MEIYKEFCFVFVSLGLCCLGVVFVIGSVVRGLDLIWRIRHTQNLRRLYAKLRKER